MSPDVIVIGAGPGGLSAAATLAQAGASVQVIDEQPYAGGQVYRATEKVTDGNSDLAAWLGEDYTKGLELIRTSQQEANIDWSFGTSVWNINCEADSIQLALLHGRETTVVEASHVILSTGAMERPTPFAGWTLPGVLSVGAAQTLLKDSGLVPQGDVVLAGSGPLLYLFANQLLNAGLRPRAILDTGRKWIDPRHLPAFARALRHLPGQIAKGRSWRKRLAGSGVPHVYGVDSLEARGSHRIESVRYRRAGQWRELGVSLLLVHDGVVPNIHLTGAVDCEHEWSDEQRHWRPCLDEHGQTSRPGLWVVGDGAGILGAGCGCRCGAQVGQAPGRRTRADACAGSDAGRRRGPPGAGETSPSPAFSGPPVSPCGGL